MKHLKYLILSLCVIPLAGCSKKEIPDHTDTIRQIQSTEKMMLAQMAVSKTVRAETSDWYTIGKRIAVYSYKSYLQAYIDLSKLTAEDFRFDEEKKSVAITLPKVDIETAGRDMQLKKEYENIGIFRSDYDAKERAAIKEKANTDFLKEIERNPEYKNQLIKRAQSKAINYFESVFKSQGYDVDVNFR